MKKAGQVLKIFTDDKMATNTPFSDVQGYGIFYFRTPKTCGYIPCKLWKIRFKTEQEQHLWGECSRLLANCTIYYNASILSNMLTYRECNGQDSDVLKQISPVAWQHINLYGRYEFNKKPEPINMDAIIQELAQFQISPNE